MPRNQLLYEYIRHGATSTVERELRFRSGEHILFNSGRNVMHVAAFFNRPEIISILKHGMARLINDVDDRDRTPLMVAASKGHMRCVLLLTNPDVINKVDDMHMTALMHSIRNRNSYIAKYLLEQQADYTIVARNGYRVPLDTVYELVPRLRPRQRQRQRPRQRPRPAISPIVEDVFRRQQERQAAITIIESFFPSEMVFYPPDTPTPEVPAVPLEAPVPTHFKNEFIEMAIALKKSCSICLEPFEKDKTVFTKCSHLLCSGCFEEPRVVKCPLCRIDIK